MKGGGFMGGGHYWETIDQAPDTVAGDGGELYTVLGPIRKKLQNGTFHCSVKIGSTIHSAISRSFEGPYGLIPGTEYRVPQKSDFSDSC